MTERPLGQVVLLNGASSSGESWNLPRSASSCSAPVPDSIVRSPGWLGPATHCTAADLRQREISRRDGELGTAVGQASVVHSHGVYDVEVNMSTASVGACSGRIRDYLDRNPAPTTRAFDQLRTGTVLDRVGRAYDDR